MNKQSSITTSSIDDLKNSLVKNAVDATATALNISYIQRDILEIKQSMKDLSGGVVTRVEGEEKDKILTDHETRIRLLETKMWQWVGISSAIAAILSTAIGFAGRLFIIK